MKGHLPPPRRLLVDYVVVNHGFCVEEFDCDSGIEQMIVGVSERLGRHHQDYGPDSLPPLDGVDEWVVKARTRVHLELPREPPVDLVDVVLHLQLDLIDDGGPLLAQNTS